MSSKDQRNLIKKKCSQLPLLALLIKDFDHKCDCTLSSYATIDVPLQGGRPERSGLLFLKLLPNRGATQKNVKREGRSRVPLPQVSARSIAVCGSFGGGTALALRHLICRVCCAWFGPAANAGKTTIGGLAARGFDEGPSRAKCALVITVYNRQGKRRAGACES